MIITDCNSRNAALVIDLLQLKAIVELLRTLKATNYVEASNSLISKGFNHMDAASLIGIGISFCSLTGFIVDGMRLANKEDAVKEEKPSDVQAEDCEVKNKQVIH